MATFVIKNVSASELHLGAFYKTLAPGEEISLADRDPAELSAMVSLQKAVVEGNATVTVTYSQNEVLSGLLTPPNSVDANAIAQVAAADVLSPVLAIRKAFVAGAPGTADDVTVIAAGSLPFKFRVLFAEVLVATHIGASTGKLRTRAGDAGVLLASFDTGSAGRASASDTATAVAVPGATEGLFLRRSDRGVAGEVVAYVRRES